MVGDKQSVFFTANIAYFKNYLPCLLQSSNIRNIIKHCLVLLYRYLLATCACLVNMVDHTAWQPHLLISSTQCNILIFATVLVLGTIKIMFKIKLKWIVSVKPPPLPIHHHRVHLSSPIPNHNNHWKCNFPMTPDVSPSINSSYLCICRLPFTAVNLPFTVYHSTIYGKLPIAVGNPSPSAHWQNVRIQ